MAAMKKGPLSLSGVVLLFKCIISCVNLSYLFFSFPQFLLPPFVAIYASFLCCLSSRDSLHVIHLCPVFGLNISGLGRTGRFGDFCLRLHWCLVLSRTCSLTLFSYFQTPLQCVCSASSLCMWAHVFWLFQTHVNISVMWLPNPKGVWQALTWNFCCW